MKPSFGPMTGTEALDPRFAQLDDLATASLLETLLDDQTQALEAVRAALPDLERVVEAATARLERGGRLVYIGAGTSGRLGLLDAAELPPTFSWPRERAIGLIAGGMRALTEAIEGAEDDARAAVRDLEKIQLSERDTLLAIAASGTTPYALAAVDYARSVGALAVGIANNPATPLLEQAEIAVLLNTGAEVISGSTRLKAGTSQKLALNLISSSVMVRLGKVYGNLMVDLRATNTKLRHRAVYLTLAATGVEEDQVRLALEQADWSVKTAIIMLQCNVGPVEARQRLERVRGRTRAALKPDPS